MRNLTKSLTLGLGLLMATSSAHAQWSQYHELSTSYSSKTPTGGTEKKSNLGSSLLNQIIYKSGENWSHSAYIATDFTYISDGESGFDQDHDKIRFQSVRKNITLIDGWESNYRIRWQVPTGDLHKQGGFGKLQTRLGFSKTFGKFSFSWMPSLEFALVDSGYEKYVAPGGAPAGNALVNWTLELSPSYEIAKGWDFGWYNAVYQTYSGGAPGADGAFGDVSWYMEPSISLPIPAPVDFSFSVSHSAKFNEDFKFFTMEKASFNLYISKAF